MKKADLIYAARVYKIFKPFYAGIGHILSYHRVGSENHSFNKYLQVQPESLEQAIEYFISKDIDIVTLDECHRRISSRKREKRFVVFTFDDGYADNLTHALPVFEKFNAPFAVFITSGFPDYQIVLWWYLLEDLVINNNEIEFKDGDNYFRYDTSNTPGKRDAFLEIRRYIRNYEHENLHPLFKKIFQMNSKELLGLTQKLALSWKQVQELSNHPLVTIGSHTVNHMVLSKLPEEKVLSEISDAIEIIEKKIGRPVSYLAYPYGIASAVSFREFEIASRCRVKMAFTTQSGNIFKSQRNSMFSIPRIEITDSWDNKYFDLYVNGFTPFFHKIIR